MAPRALRTHVLYETTSGGEPHGCGDIRLLRPLSYGTNQATISLSYGPRPPAEPVDVVVIERLWDHSCDWLQHRPLLQKLRQQGTTIICEIDDDLFSIEPELGLISPPGEGQKMWLRQILRFADGVIVSTANLAARLRGLNANIEIVPNALDDRLFEPSRNMAEKKKTGTTIPTVLGYMGTMTHLADLLSIIQPLRSLLARYSPRVRLEIVGVGESELLQQAFAGLPVQVLRVPPGAVAYPGFVDWMQRALDWDFALAPLIDSTFTRSKSDIKFLDYSAQGIPGIFSDVPAYRRTVRHLENGILAKDPASWWTWLDRLVRDDDLRRRLARKAHQDVWHGRMLQTEATRWDLALRSSATRGRSCEARSGTCD
jgi:glycosyltransferase involved in cell wall biosynthesis